jgi:hypothetical protein
VLHAKFLGQKEPSDKILAANSQPSFLNTDICCRPLGCFFQIDAPKAQKPTGGMPELQTKSLIIINLIRSHQRNFLL